MNVDTIIDTTDYQIDLFCCATENKAVTRNIFQLKWQIVCHLNHIPNNVIYVSCDKIYVKL